jgi:hypothetical protein
MPILSPARLLAGLITGACLLLAGPLFAAKTDVIELKNGDHITGEIKSLDRGLLKFKTDHAGTISIEWEYVARVKGDRLLEFEMHSGERYFGTVVNAAESGKMIVRTTTQEEQLLVIADTVRISQLDEKGSVWDKVDGYIDFGYSDTKATDVREFTFDAGISHRDRKRLLDFSYVTNRSDSGTSNSTSTTFKGERRGFLKNRWFRSGILQLDRNDSLGIDLRTRAGGGLGRYLVQTNSQVFAVGAGLALSREDLSDGGRTDSVEGILGLGYDVFVFDDPDLDVNLDVSLLPSFSVSGRWRGQAQLQFSYEIIDDLYAELTLREAFDTKPQSAGAEKNDYTITTSIGYSF